MHVVRTVAEYRAAVARDGGHEMVDLAAVAPGIKLDLKYATTDNFTGRRLYPVARALLRRKAALALKAVQADLEARGMGLKVYDAYRPHRVTVEMWNSRMAPGRFISPPWYGSSHNRGVAVDVTLVNAATGTELRMPTRFDTFSAASAHAYAGASAEATRNRETLRAAMRARGFSSLLNEWWHYQLSGSTAFAVLDLPFDVF